MKDFEYIQPDDTAAAVRFLGEGEPSWSDVQRRVFAGGQDLYGELKTGIVEAAGLVNLKAIGELEETARRPDGNLRLGALVRLAELEQFPAVDAVAKLLGEAAATVASHQIRSQATLGGNLCQRPRCLYYRRPELICLKKGGDECFAYGGHNKYNAILGGGPSFIVHPSDLAPALVALDARATIQGSAERELALADFFTSPSEGDVTRENVLAPDEVLTAVETRLPEPSAWSATYLKFQEREGFDFALAAVALCVRVDGDTVADARLVLGGVAPRPWRCPEAEERLIGARISGSDNSTLFGEVAELALTGAEPLEHNAYKVPLTQGLVQRALRQLLRP